MQSYEIMYDIDKIEKEKKIGKGTPPWKTE
jgi:hypothetical protein